MESKQQAHRRREKEYVAELEAKVKELETKYWALYHENQELKSQVYYLETRPKR